MKQTAKRFSSLLFALLFIVGALIVLFDLVEPAYSDLQNAKGKEISQAAFLANEEKVVAQVKDLVASFQSQAQNIDAVSLALPVGPNLAGAITQITGVAVANAISVQSMTVSIQGAAASAPRQSAASGQIANAAFGGTITQPLGSITFQVTATGSYESFKNFLHGLETNTRIFDVKSMNIREITNAALGTRAAATQDNFLYNLAVTGYYQ